MGPSGAIIMGIFAGVFGVAALRLGVPRHPVWTVVPLLVSAAIVWRALRAARAGTTVTPESERIGRVVMWASAAEGVGVVVAINVVKNLGLEGRLLPAIALVVGLHFVPMAYAIPHRPFYALAGFLLAVVVAGFLVPPALGPLVGGLGACLALWMACLNALRSPRAT